MRITKDTPCYCSPQYSSNVVISYSINTTLNNYYVFTETIQSDVPIVTRYEIPYLASPGEYLSGTGVPLNEQHIVDSWRNGYSFPDHIDTSSTPRVAFTLKSSSVKGGGPMMVYRYAEWLSQLGIDVAIYSDDAPPDWIPLTVRFEQHCSDPDRYAAITEPVVIVFSVQELPVLFRYCSTDGKRVYHFCQGLEDYQYIPPPDNNLGTRVPVFDLLHSLPVRRIAVSRHIEQYFLQRYGQRTHTIMNGVDLDTFYPAAPRMPGKHWTIALLGNPTIPLKGVLQALMALVLVQKELPDYCFHLRVVSGEDVSSRFDSDFKHPAVTFSIQYRLTPDQIRELFQSADAYINASYYEGFGLPSLEAMACGLPVVQVDNHGLDGVIVDGENCVVSKSQDPRHIAGALLRLITDKALRQRVRNMGLVTAQQFSVHSQATMFVKEFSSILGVRFDERKVNHLVDAPLCSPGVGDTIMGNDELKGNIPPLFTVLVPTYNQARYLPACLESLLHQTCPNWEAVVVNDGSTDNTRELLERYADKDSRLRVFHKANGGVATALNMALENARGKWICWLSSDDMFEPDKLETQVRAFAVHPGKYFFHTNYNVFYEESGRLSAIELPEDFVPPESLQVLKFFEINYVNGISVCVHRSAFEKIGNFNTILRNGQDFDMWLRISAAYRSQYIEQRTCITRVHKEQGSSISADAGIFDSARASLDFLNNHHFKELFPALDLDSPEHGLLAIQAVFKMLINPLAYINCCGFGPALLGRMREWLGYPAQSYYVSILNSSQFKAIVEGIVTSDLPISLRVAFQEFYTELGRPYLYQTQDSLKLLEQQACFLDSIPGAAGEAASLWQYLARYGKSARSDQPLKNNLPYWQKMQEQGYFEKHPLYGGEHDGLALFGSEVEIIHCYTSLKRDMNVVVIGCGYGRESTLIAPHVRHVYGIDVSDIILDKARAFTAAHGVTNFTAVPADRWQQEIPDDIDLVYCMVVFQHLTRDLVSDYINGLTRKLNYDGKMLCQFCESQYGTNDATMDVYEPNVSWTADQIRDLLRKSGLNLYKLDTTLVNNDVCWHWAFFGRLSSEVS